MRVDSLDAPFVLSEPIEAGASLHWAQDRA
jgi:hypothetical protein